MFSAAPRATLAPLSCSANFPRAQYLDIRTLTHELIVTDSSFDDIDVAQSLFIEISRPHRKNIIGGISYRPPNQKVGDFVSKNNELLQKISRGKKMLLMVDFNLDFIGFQHHQNTGEFLDDLHSNMFFPMLTHPTRILSHTATLLDNIFTNKLFDHSRSGFNIIVYS